MVGASTWYMADLEHSYKAKHSSFSGFSEDTGSVCRGSYLVCTSTPGWLSLGLRTSERVFSHSLLESSYLAIRFRSCSLYSCTLDFSSTCLKFKSLLAVTNSPLTQLIPWCTVKKFPDRLQCFMVMGSARVPTQAHTRPYANACGDANTALLLTMLGKK
jgi:hypothetical protein